VNAHDTGALLLRTDLAMLRRDPAAAIADLRAVLRDQPRSTPLIRALAHAYVENGQPELAEEGLRSALDAAPGDSALRVALAQLLADFHRDDEAVALLEQTLSAQPDALDALASLARLEVRRGHAAAASERLNKFVAAHPEDAIASNVLGEVYLAAKDYAHAVEPLERATRLSPGWWLAWRNLAQARLGAGDTAHAAHAYERGIAAAGERPELVTDLAALYEREGRIDAAISSLESLHQSAPRWAVAANNLAMLLVTYRTDRDSLDRARDLTSGFADSEDPSLIDTAGWVHFKRGELQLALPQLEKALARDPESNVVRYHLGMAELRAGQHDKARADLQRAIVGARFTGIDEARSALAQLGIRTG
jgi:predicted Zn-dependent protease